MDMEGKLIVWEKGRFALIWPTPNVVLLVV